MSSKGQATILIVDDSMLNRALLADMIGDAYRIVEAEDGKQAVAALQKEGTGISLVLLDYVMPQMNGFDVLEANAECIDVAFEEDGDDVHVVIYLGGTQNTITINGFEEVYRG